MGNWLQVWIWFKGNFKKFRVEIEIPAAIFDWFSKQRLNLPLLLSDWYCWMLGLTDLLGYGKKMTSDKKMICNSYQRYKCVNRDYCSHFSLIFKITSKFLIIFVRLTLGNGGIDGYTGPRLEFSLKVIVKECRVKIEILAAIFDWISKQQFNLLLFLSDRYCGKFLLTDLPCRGGKMASDMNFILSPY